MVSVTMPWSQDTSTSLGLDKYCQCLGLGRLASQSRLFKSRDQDRFSAKLCRPK